MKKILLSVVLLSFAVVMKGQGLINGLTSVADDALLLSISLDVIDNTISTGDKLQIISDEIQRTQNMINNPYFMKYSSTYGRNQVIRDIRTYSKEVEIYARTLANMAKLLTALGTAITANEEEDAEITVEEVAAKLATAGSSFNVMGTGGGPGLANQEVVAALKRNRQVADKDSFQGQILNFLLQLQAFNNSIDQLYTNVVRIQSGIVTSFGVGVVMYGTQYNLYSYIDKSNAKYQSNIQKATALNKAQIEQMRKQMNDMVNKIAIAHKQEMVKQANRK